MGCSHVVKRLFFLTSCGGKWASCLRWGVICWMETFVAQLACSFWCHCSGQVSSSVTGLSPRPSPFLAPCSCLASVLTLLRWVLRSAQGRGHGHIAANRLGKEECSFWQSVPSCSHRTLPPQAGAEQISDFSCLLSPLAAWHHPPPSMSSENARTLQISGQSPLLFWKVK